MSVAPQHVQRFLLVYSPCLSPHNMYRDSILSTAHVCRPTTCTEIPSCLQPLLVALAIFPPSSTKPFLHVLFFIGLKYSHCFVCSPVASPRLSRQPVQQRHARPQLPRGLRAARAQPDVSDRPGHVLACHLPHAVLAVRGSAGVRRFGTENTDASLHVLRAVGVSGTLQRLRRLPLCAQ